MTANDENIALSNLLVELERMAKLFEEHDRAKEAQCARLLMNRLEQNSADEETASVDSAS